MEDHRLGDLLRELPREQARPGFTARVLHRLDAPERRRWIPIPRLALATALTVVLAVAAGVLCGARGEGPAACRPRRGPPGAPPRWAGREGGGRGVGGPP